MTKPLIVAALVALLAYGLIEARPLLSGPALALNAPLDGMTYPDGLVTIEGRAERAASLTLDGAPLLPDQSGRFSSILALPSGTSILTVIATDRFGRSVKTTRTIYIP